MNRAFMDICQIGNFSVDEDINLSEVKKLRKKNGRLFAVLNKKEYELYAMDGDAEMVVRNFSDYPDEENESIYECYSINGHLVVMLYVFASVRRIELESETMHFYMDRSLKNQYESNGKIKDGDEVKFLQDEFLTNKSVFIAEYQGGKATKTFQMYGNIYRADVERERAGIFKIKRLFPYKVNNRVGSMLQIYGCVKFVTFEDTFKIVGHDVPISEIKTNEIFNAWQEFVDFEGKIFHDEVVELGYVKYRSCHLDGNEIVFEEFNKNISDEPLFADSADEREYDIVFSMEGKDFNNIEEIIEQRDQSRESSINLGRVKNESFDSNKLIFNLPYVERRIPQKGYIILSDRSIKIQEGRRNKVMRMIERRSNSTSNMLMRLSAGEEDSQTGGDIVPITTEVLKKMFERTDVELKGTFKEAMNIALNTPDIALIQGPPGTGKTTLINGIIARLNSMGNKNYKILVSSEQHEALYNVVDKLSNNSIPPFVTSEKYAAAAKEENNNKMLENVEGFQARFLKRCDEILNEGSAKSRFSTELIKLIFDIRSIADNNYSQSVIEEKMQSITDAAMEMGIWGDVKECVDQIRSKLYASKIDWEDERPGMDLIKRKLSAQRTDMTAFYEDDGCYQLEELQRLLALYGYNDLLIDEKSKEALKTERNEFVPQGQYLRVA